MAFSFIEIEGAKTRNVRVLFAVLMGFYFLGFLLFFNVYADWLKSPRFADPTIAIPYHTLRWFWAPYLPSLRALGWASLAAILTAGVHWLWATHRMVERMLTLMGAKPLDTEDRYHIQFRNIVDEMSAASGGRRFEACVVNSPALNAFALQDLKGRAVLGVTEGLLARLNRRQLETVVGHEASHVLWGDGLTATVVAVLSGLFAGNLRQGFRALKRVDSDARTDAVFLFFPLILFHLLSHVLVMFLSREKEHRADATAVRLTRDPLSLAESLQLILDNPRGSGLPWEEVSSVFIVSPTSGFLSEKKGFFADLFSTHPPTRDRIGILAGMAGVNPDSLTEGLRGRAREEAEAPLPVAAPAPPAPPVALWQALVGGTWQGSFTLAQLAALEGFAPDSWVKSGGGVPRPAQEFPDLMPLFKGTWNPSPSAPERRLCSLCRQDMGLVQVKGVPVWRCGTCGGHLVKKDKIPRLLARENMGFSPEAVQWAASLPRRAPGWTPKEGNPSGRACPFCGAEMGRKPLAALLPYVMEVEECSPCGWLWFDKNELEALQIHGQAREKGSGSGNPYMA
jgi:heat shock protein HtpX